MDYKTEDDLKADGFVLTVNVFHGGNGLGKVYEKIVDGARVLYSVDVDGTVAPYVSPSQPVEPVLEPETPVAEVPKEEFASEVEEKEPEEESSSEEFASE